MEETLNPQNLKPQTLTPKPQTLNPKPRFGPQSPGTVPKWEKDGKEYPFGTLVSYLLSPEGTSLDPKP